MRSFSIRVATVILISASSLYAESPRVSAIQRFGISGHIQSVGLHHGFHVEIIGASSQASEYFKPNDIIVKVDGDDIRSTDHLRAALAEAYSDDGEVAFTYMRGTSLDHLELRCNLKKAKPGGSKRDTDR